MNQAFIEHAQATLAADPVLAALFERQSIAPPEQRTDYFASLCRSIIGQQVSVAAARAIAGRFEARTGLDPLVTAGLSDDDVKQIGLSRQKAGYLRDLGAHFAANPALYDHLEALDDEAVIRDLVAVKGVGVWTAQMFLLFTLGRPDIFAPDDVGLQKGLQKLYGWDALPPRRELAAFAERWAPYRSVMSLHLWQLLDAAPAA